MSIIPAKYKLQLYKGSTCDLTFTFYTDEDETVLMDLTGYSAAAKVRASYGAAAALVSLTSSVFTPPAQDGLILGGTAGTVRLYIRNATLASLDPSAFTVDTDNGLYSGVWDLELTNAAGETSRYVMGPVDLSLEATY